MMTASRRPRNYLAGNARAGAGAEAPAGTEGPRAAARLNPDRPSRMLGVALIVLPSDRGESG
jgi:hypothetical protein